MTDIQGAGAGNLNPSEVEALARAICEVEVRGYAGRTASVAELVDDGWTSWTKHAQAALTASRAWLAEHGRVVVTVMTLLSAVEKWAVADLATELDRHDLRALRERFEEAITQSAAEEAK